MQNINSVEMKALWQKTCSKERMGVIKMMSYMLQGEESASAAEGWLKWNKGFNIWVGILKEVLKYSDYNAGSWNLHKIWQEQLNGEKERKGHKQAQP